jgi:GTPase SAR1 family protein
MDVPGNARVRDFMDKLTATTNVSKYVELPMIAVMGDTSSGKSSLLSSISMVELPSNSKLTTRCPTMLRMSKSDKKYATVSIQWKQKPDSVKEEDLAFPMETIEEDHWDTLPDIIDRAQQHIITWTGKEVARDCVHVNVFAPHCHDLTLIDLPGIVRSRGEGESASIVEDIDGLIQDNLSNSRCMILAVVPANVDFHNSQIMANAKEVDPDTRRTIPVITKPDLIDSGAEDDVLQLLRGEKIKFDLGFHMIKGRGQAELDQNMSIAGGLTVESSFFQNTQPWRDIDNRDMFGTAQLRTKLGELQLQMIRDTIPDIVKNMSEKKQLAEGELQEMGQMFGTPSDRLLYFRNRIHVFVTQLKASLTGNGFTGTYVPASAALHKAAKVFQDSIQKGRLSNISELSVGTRVIATKGTNDPIKGEVTRVWTDFIKVTCDKNGEVTDFAVEEVRRDPAWLMDIISEQRTHTFPCFLNEQVFRAVSSDFTEKDCVPHCHAILLATFTLLSESIDECLESSGFGRRFQSLRLMVQQKAKLEAQKLFTREKSRLKEYLADEMDPYT